MTDELRKKKPSSRPARKQARPDRAAPLKRPPGLPARELALAQVCDVLYGGHTMAATRSLSDDLPDSDTLNTSDKGLARLIAATVLRQKPVLDDILDAHLQRALPNRYNKVRAILLCAGAQLLILKTPPHAAINLAVEQTRLDRRVSHLTGLVNAVLRKVARHGPEAIAKTNVARRSIPEWLWRRWASAYGEKAAQDIARASLAEAPLDITVKSDPHTWAEQLNATVLATNTLRRSGGGRIEKLDGFSDGRWWVQDAAAALPARLLGDIKGATVADLCAAPGGKTAQLASAGANVIAIDNDKTRIKRMRENLDRLGLDADLVCADALAWKPDVKPDHILLDAPCTSTGTIRRHPDILHLKRDADIATLAHLQSKMLNAAYDMLAPQGTLVYCTCSLEPEEGEHQISKFLNATPDARLHPIAPGEAGIKPDWLNTEGMLRTLPFHDPRKVNSTTGTREVGGGMDGFFAARLVKTR